MIRAPIGDLAYWNKRVDFLTKAIATKWDMLAKPSGNPIYDPKRWKTISGDGASKPRLQSKPSEWMTACASAMSIIQAIFFGLMGRVRINQG